MILGAAKEYIKEKDRSDKEKDAVRKLMEDLQTQVDRYLPNQEQ